jgi:hypothetical protein
MRRRWTDRLLPWVGTGLLTMGAFQATLVVLQGKATELRVLGTGLLIMGGGFGLIARGTHGARRWAFIVGGLGLGAALAGALSG